MPEWLSIELATVSALAPFVIALLGWAMKTSRKVARLEVRVDELQKRGDG